MFFMSMSLQLYTAMPLPALSSLRVLYFVLIDGMKVVGAVSTGFHCEGDHEMKSSLHCTNNGEKKVFAKKSGPRFP